MYHAACKLSYNHSIRCTHSYPFSFFLFFEKPRMFTRNSLFVIARWFIIPAGHTYLIGADRNPNWRGMLFVIPFPRWPLVCYTYGSFFIFFKKIMRQGRGSEATEAVFCLQAKKPLHSGSYEHRVPKIKNKTFFCMRDSTS